MGALHAFSFAEFLDSLISLAGAFILGTLIGAERQYRQRSGGLRTNVLVAVGAATFVDIGMHLNGNVGGVHVVSYVVSGVGFLGAGVITKEGKNVWASTPQRRCGARPPSGRAPARISPSKRSR